MMSGLNQRWQALQPSEQRLLKIAAPLILLMLGYLLIWQPLQQHWAESAQQEQQQIRLLQRLQSVEGQLPPVQPMDARRWQALAASDGFKQVQAEEQAGIWLLQASLTHADQLQRFLQRAAEQGWHWGELQLDAGEPGQALQLKMELLPL